MRAPFLRAKSDKVADPAQLPFDTPVPARGVYRALGTRVGARVVASVCQAITMILLARSVGVESFGAFGQALGIGYFISGLMSFGLGTWALRLFAEPHAHSVAITMARVRVSTSTAAASLTLALSVVIDGSSHLMAFACGCLLVMSDSIAELTQALVAGERRHGLASVLILINRVTPTVTLLIGFATSTDSYTSLAVGLLLATAASSIPLRWRGSGASIKYLAQGTRGYWLATLATSLSQLDVVAVRAGAGLAAAGVYTAASRIGGPLNILLGSMMSIIVPNMSSLDSAAQQRAHKRLLRGVLLYAIILGLAAPGISYLVVVLLGDDYRRGYVVYTAFVLSAAVSAVSQVMQARLYILGLPSKVALALLFGGVAGLILLIILGSELGLLGIAIAHVGMQLSIAAGLAIALRLTPKTSTARIGE